MTSLMAGLKLIPLQSEAADLYIDIIRALYVNDH